MAIDPRISLGVQSVQLNDPLETVGKAVALQNALANGKAQQQRQAIDQEQLRGLKTKNDETDRSLADERNLEGIWNEAGGDWNKTRDLAVARGINPKIVTQIDTNIANHAANVAKQSESDIKLARDKNAFAYDALSSAAALENDPTAQKAEYDAKVQEGITKGLFKPAEVVPYQGPQSVRQMRNKFATEKNILDQADEIRKAKAAKLEEDTKTADLTLKNLEISGQKPIQAADLQKQQEAEKTTDIKNYEYAKKTGAIPPNQTFEQWSTNDANRKKASDFTAIAALDREANTFRAPHQKSLNDADTKLQTVADAKAMINGGAVGQALGLPKVLSAVVGGAGSGLRMTEPELKRIAGARGIKGDVEGFFNQLSGQGSLTAEQKRQATQILDDVAQRLREKRNIADDALNRINSAKSRDEIVGVDRDVRKKISDLETGAPSGQSRIKILKVE